MILHYPVYLNFVHPKVQDRARARGVTMKSLEYQFKRNSPKIRKKTFIYILQCCLE